MNDSSSLICLNVQCLARRYKLNYYERLRNLFASNKLCVPSSQEDERVVKQIMELCDIKFDFILDSDECNLILHYLCCN